MNERIRELAEQATNIVEMVGPQGYTSSYANFDREKFAELIVRECLKIVEPDRTSGDEWCVTLDETAQSIRQHFGVEE
jgi:hypothetical protein